MHPTETIVFGVFRESVDAVTAARTTVALARIRIVVEAAQVVEVRDPVSERAIEERCDVEARPAVATAQVIDWFWPLADRLPRGAYAGAPVIKIAHLDTGVSNHPCA